MQRKRSKGSIWRPAFMALCACLLADMACGNTGGINQPPAAENDLLQFSAGGHIMGFKPDKVYLVNTSDFLSVEFLGSHDVSPVGTAAESDKAKDDPALPQNSRNTLAGLQRVEYQELWDGITLRYDAVQAGIAESTYFIQPGAAVADIRLRYNAETQVQEDGSLRINLSTRQGYITESRPVAWQMLDGQKKEVQVAYHIEDGTIGFQTGEYDRDHELIIDPTYQWHTFYGSRESDHGNSIAIDQSGNVYVTGLSSASWVVDDGLMASYLPKHAHSGNDDIMVLKLDSSGAYQWHTFYGSTAGDQGTGIAIDQSGNVYVTGSSGASWVVYEGPINYQFIHLPKHAHSGAQDVTVLKLNSSGAYQWHTFYGSANSDVGLGITVDGNDDIHVTGWSDASWVVYGSGMIAYLPKHAHSGAQDVTVLKLNSSGAYQWHTFYGSANSDVGLGITVDGNDDIYVTGWSDASWVIYGGTIDFPIAYLPKHAHSGGQDVTVLKLDSSGSYRWHTFYGSAGEDEGEGITIDLGGNVYITGWSDASWVVYGSGMIAYLPKHAHSGNSDIMVLKLDSSGTYQWHTFYGSAMLDHAKGIAVDGNDDIYLSGESYASWGNPVNPYNGGVSDIVTCKLTQFRESPLAHL